MSRISCVVLEKNPTSMFVLGGVASCLCMFAGVDIQ